ACRGEASRPSTALIRGPITGTTERPRSPAPSRRTPELMGTGMPERILLVDDDPRVRDVLSRFLEREGYVTIPAVSGEEALERVASHPPDLVLLDVQLPGIDGFTVCRVLKDNEATALIPVTILSGLQDAEARTRGIESGADDFITKPFEYT